MTNIKNWLNKMGKKKGLRKEQEELLERAINETDEEKRRELFDELSGMIEIWKIDDTNKRIKVIKEFLEEIKNSRGNIMKMKKYSIRFGEFEPILYPDNIDTIKTYLRILEKQ